MYFALSTFISYEHIFLDLQNEDIIQEWLFGKKNKPIDCLTGRLVQLYSGMLQIQMTFSAYAQHLRKP